MKAEVSGANCAYRPMIVSESPPIHGARYLEEFVSRKAVSFLGEMPSSVLPFQPFPLHKGATLLITHCRTAKTMVPTGLADRFVR